MAKIRTLEQAKAFRAKIENAAKHLPEEEAMNSLELFPKWDPSKEYPVGTKVRHGNKLYNCLETVAANSKNFLEERWELIADIKEDILNNITKE